MVRARLDTTALVAIALCLAVAGVDAKRPPKPCNVTNPAVENCLPSCKIPCRTENCLYQCHYDSTLAFIKLAVTPAEGPSRAAFDERVAQLALYISPDVKLRISPLGEFDGRPTVSEYIATFVHPLGLGSRVSVVAGDIIYFANTGNVAALRFDLNYTVVGDPTKRIVTLTGFMFNEFDPVTQKLVAGDWSFIRFPEFQLALNAPLPVRVTDEVAGRIVQGVCGVDATVCKPLNMSGYDNTTDCAAFVSGLPRVDPYGLQGNNMYCRFLHMAYATVEPLVHCPHISRSGGNKCVDRPYNYYFSAFPNHNFVGKPSRTSG